MKAKSWRKKYNPRSIRYDRNSFMFHNKTVRFSTHRLPLFLQVLYEITEGKLGVLEPVPTTPAGPSKEPAAPEPEEEEEEEEDLTEMQSRLQALRS